MKPLIIGKTGQLAHCLSEANSPTLSNAQFWGRDELDWLDEKDYAQQIANFKPSHIVNATAYTAVDLAESHKDDAYAVNSSGPRMLAQVAKSLDIPFIHVSTDYVFDGKANQPYSVGQIPNPLNVYGASKLAGEEGIRSSGCQHVIIRTSWVFSAVGSNFVKTMLQLHRQSELTIVDDQIGRPTYAGDLAQLIICILEQPNGLPTGTYHHSGGEQVSWFEFADAIFETATTLGAISTRPYIIPCNTRQYEEAQRAMGTEAIAPRPLYGVLAQSPELDQLAPLASWRKALPGVITRLAKAIN